MDNCGIFIQGNITQWLKKGWVTAVYYNMDESQKHWQKYINMKYKNQWGGKVCSNVFSVSYSH